MIIRLIVGHIKKTWLYKIIYFPEPYIVDLSNYATISDIKGVTGIDSSKFGRKACLACLKSDVHKLDIDKLETTPVDLSKLSNVVKKCCC